MSWTAVDAVLDLAPPDLTARELKVLIALARRAAPDRTGALMCWPTLPTIAADARVSRATAARALDDLTRRGLIARFRTQSVSVTYLTLLADRPI